MLFWTEILYLNDGIIISTVMLRHERQAVFVPEWLKWPWGFPPSHHSLFLTAETVRFFHRPSCQMKAFDRMASFFRRQTERVGVNGLQADSTMLSVVTVPQPPAHISRLQLDKEKRRPARHEYAPSHSVSCVTSIFTTTCGFKVESLVPWQVLLIKRPLSTIVSISKSLHPQLLQKNCLCN